MSNSNANKPILFIERKKEFENNKDNTSNNKINNKKNAKVISLSNYKRLKSKKDHNKKDNTKKESNLTIDKIKKKVFLIVILALFLLMFATTLMKQKSYSQIPANKFVAQSSQISGVDASTYKSITKRVVGKYTSNGYKVSVLKLHRNGNLVYSEGYFNVPNEGKVNYDLVLENDSPTSLIINGNEYIKK